MTAVISIKYPYCNLMPCKAFADSFNMSTGVISGNFSTKTVLKS